MILSLLGCKKYKPIDCKDFHQLVASNNIPQVKYHLENNQNVNCTVNANVTPLMTASLYDRINLIQLLIDNGAEINFQTESGWTALLYASENGNFNSVKLLIANGADINKTLKGGENAFIQACFKGHSKIANYLFDNGADVNTPNNEIGLNGLILASNLGNLELVEKVLPKTKDINHANKYGETALMRAAIEGHFDVLKFLIKNGADKELKDNFGNNALFYTQKFEHPEIEEYLTDK